MSAQYFMRVRGRVLGPYEEDKLQALAHRGQLSKMHEVSTDGLTWARASHFPNLFAGAPVAEEIYQQVPEQRTAEKPEPVSFAPQNVPQQTPQTNKGQWFYTSGGMQCGPVDYSQLQLLSASGQLTGNDQVWTEGMQGWVLASTVIRVASPTPIPGTTKFCFSCGKTLATLAEICPNCGVRQPTSGHVGGAVEAPPSRVTACLLAIFLGGFGAHKFYLGQTGMGILYLLSTILLCWTLIVPIVISLVSLVEGLVYLSYSDTKFANTYG
jgi:TM2 domain-containing membrane protein YozV